LQEPTAVGAVFQNFSGLGPAALWPRAHLGEARPAGQFRHRSKSAAMALADPALRGPDREGCDKMLAFTKADEKAPMIGRLGRRLVM